jgi:hypothetical protein
MTQNVPWTEAAFGLAVPHLVVVEHFRSYADVPLRAIQGAGWLGAGLALDAYVPAPGSSGVSGAAVVLVGNLEGFMDGSLNGTATPLAVDARTPRVVTLALRLDLLGVPAAARPPGRCWELLPQVGGGSWPPSPRAVNSSDSKTGVNLQLTVHLAPEAGGALVLTAC